MNDGDRELRLAQLRVQKAAAETGSGCMQMFSGCGLFIFGPIALVLIVVILYRVGHWLGLVR